MTNDTSGRALPEGAGIVAEAATTAAVSSSITSLLAELERSDAWVKQNVGNRQATDEDWDAWCDEQHVTLGRIADLPNTPEYLQLRARAVGSAVDNTADLANLDLSELGAHAESTAGILVRQVLSCVLDGEMRA